MPYVVITKGPSRIRKFAAATMLDAIEKAQDLQKQGMVVIITDDSGRVIDTLNQYVSADMVLAKQPH
jgi:inosine/xanthosine triphosphate pyrophosphatase family protein